MLDCSRTDARESLPETVSRDIRKFAEVGKLGHTELCGHSPLQPRRKYLRQHKSCNDMPC
jgi:hypothetical protein